MNQIMNASAWFVGTRYFVCFVLSMGLVHESNAQTGDSVTDSMIGPINEYVIGNSSATAWDNGSNILNCASGSPSREVQCPNDSTYVPMVSTGGYSSWGVGLETIYAIEWGFDCYLVPVVVFVNGNSSFNWVLICQGGWNSIPAVTVGRAAMRNRWGTQTSSVSSVSNIISTMAFKASDLPVCTPFHSGFDSPCRLLQEPLPLAPNVTFLADAGYETEISMDDPECDMLFYFRTGNISDVNSNCFIVSALR